MYLQVKSLSKRYGENLVVNNVSFNVEKGEMLCILGPSGCGKTTVLNAIGGFLTGVEGQIIVDGEDITYLPAEEREVSTVFQSYGLFPHMNVLENVKYGLRFNNTPKSQREKFAMQMLEMVGLTQHVYKKVHELSGGQRQRVALARSLVVKPKVLLLDEPLSNLDAKMRDDMREEIKRIQKEFEITTILVTHDQQEAFELADKIVLLNKGEIQQISDSETLYNQPHNEFAADFIGDINQIGDYYIRPEQVILGEQGESGVIKNIVFRGETLELHIQVEGGPYVKAIVLNRESYDVGQVVHVDYKRHLIKLQEE